MMKPITLALALALTPMLTLTAAEKPGKTGGSAEIANTDVVESGTYSGTAHKVDAEEKEIYVKTTDGKILELYLKPDTKLTKGGKTVAFDALKEGQKLEVKVEKDGKRLKPLAVMIAE